MKKKQEDFQKEYNEMLAKGESWAMFKAMKKVWSDDMAAAKLKAKDNTFAGSAGKMASMMDAVNEGTAGMDDLELPMVKIGDASVASPFTSKMPSIRGCLDIIRQVTLNSPINIIKYDIT
jgi:cation-transporting ATPase 13A1